MWNRAPYNRRAWNWPRLTRPETVSLHVLADPVLVVEAVPQFRLGSDAGIYVASEPTIQVDPDDPCATDQKFTIRVLKNPVIEIPPTPLLVVYTGNKRRPCAIPLDPESEYFTSKPYSVQAIEGIQLDPVSIEELQHLSGYIEGFGPIQTEVASVLLRQILRTYDNGAPEGIDANQAEVTSILLETKLVTYDEWLQEPEGIDAGQAEVTSISLVIAVGYVEYTNWPAEGFDAGQAEITSISLVTP